MYPSTCFNRSFANHAPTIKCFSFSLSSVPKAPSICLIFSQKKETTKLTQALFHVKKFSAFLSVHDGLALPQDPSFIILILQIMFQQGFSVPGIGVEKGIPMNQNYIKIVYTYVEIFLYKLGCWELLPQVILNSITRIFRIGQHTVTESADFGFIPDNSTTLTPPGSPGVSREAKLSTEFEFGSLVH